LIAHLLGALETKGLAGGCASDTKLFDDGLILPNRNNGVLESSNILYASAAELTPAATRQGGPKFGREHLLHMLFCIAPTGEERVGLLWGFTTVNV